MSTPKRSHSPRDLQPAPQHRQIRPSTRSTSFFDLPAEIRIQIYKISLGNIVLHVVPLNSITSGYGPSLASTCRQIRNEVLPIIHSACAIEADVTDFNFSGLLNWVQAIPPRERRYLCKNDRLLIRLCTTQHTLTSHETLRRWLHECADPCRPQGTWRYSGPVPSMRVANDLRRRMRRLKHQRKQDELKRMMESISVSTE